MTNGRSVAIVAACGIALWAVAKTGATRLEHRAARAPEADEEEAASEAASEVTANAPPPRALRAAEPPATATAARARARPNDEASTAASELRGGDLVLALARDPGSQAEPEPPVSEDGVVGELPPSIDVPETPQRTRLEAAFEAASPDPSRTDAMRAHLQRFAQEGGIEREVVEDADCHGDICRVRLSFQGPTDALRFQSATQRAEFGYQVVPTDMQGPMVNADPGVAAPPWEVEVLLEPSDPAAVEE